MHRPAVRSPARSERICAQYPPTPQVWHTTNHTDAQRITLTLDIIHKNMGGGGIRSPYGALCVTMAIASVVPLSWALASARPANKLGFANAFGRLRLRGGRNKDAFPMPEGKEAAFRMHSGRCFSGAAARRCSVHAHRQPLQSQNGSSEGTPSRRSQWPRGGIAACTFAPRIQRGTFLLE